MSHKPRLVDTCPKCKTELLPGNEPCPNTKCEYNNNGLNPRYEALANYPSVGRIQGFEVFDTTEEP